jgi:poly-D-alanine transfer protein DltD
MEDVLGFFDELGFYWKHGEISSDVLYEHFYSNMRTYCQTTMGYIRNEQKQESKADWENVEPLFNELTRIEANRNDVDITNCVWDVKTLQQYLNSEMRLKH